MGKYKKFIHCGSVVAEWKSTKPDAVKSDQQSVGSSPGRDTSVLLSNTLLTIASP